MRTLIWSQHLLGTGHLQRSARLAEALAARGADVTLVNGGPPPASVPRAYARVDLPAVQAADVDFSGLVDAVGAPVDDAVWRARSARLADVAAPVPDLVVIEMFPFGRRAFARELVPFLDDWRRRSHRPRLVVSLRDVLVAKNRPERAVETALRVWRWFDRVLVHADPRVVRLERTFPQARAVAAWLRYTGFIAPELPPPAAVRRGIVVSAGGGRVGRALLFAAAAAAMMLPADFGPWTLVAGRGLPEADWVRLRDHVGANVLLERHVDDLPERLARARLSVSQAGYNTVVEALALRCPMVLVPFAAGAETEQSERARSVAALGLATIVGELALTPATLAEAVDARMRAPRPDLAVDTGGAVKSAALLTALVEGRS